MYPFFDGGGEWKVRVKCIQGTTYNLYIPGDGTSNITYNIMRIDVFNQGLFIMLATTGANTDDLMVGDTIKVSGTSYDDYNSTFTISEKMGSWQIMVSPEPTDHGEEECNPYPNCNQNDANPNMQLVHITGTWPYGSKSGQMMCSGGTGSGCFVAGTLIDTPKGKIPIETIKFGDEVYTFNDYDDEKSVSTVENLVSHEPDETAGDIVKIKTNLNDVVTTLNHPFIRIDGKGIHRWEQVFDFNVGDIIIDENGEGLIIEEIEMLNMSAETYNLTIKDTHHYIANGFRVHNAYGKNRRHTNIRPSDRIDHRYPRNLESTVPLDQVISEPKTDKPGIVR